MMTIETIDGEKRLVVWYTADIKTTLGRRLINLDNRTLAVFRDANCIEHIATALPPLPRHPQNDEATVRLLSLYRAHGINVFMEWGSKTCRLWSSVEDTAIDKMLISDAAITHATYNGEQIELVFEEMNDDDLRFTM